MPFIDPAWQGKVQFYELVFGFWTSYVVLVLLWEKVLRRPLAEWRYLLIGFIGAAAFLVNHYFQYAPFWGLLMTLYTIAFFAVWGVYGVAGHGGWLWKLAAFVPGVIYSIAYILFESLARQGHNVWGVNEFWWMLVSVPGFLWLIMWRAKAGRAA